jgi:hypothetical protein
MITAGLMHSENMKFKMKSREEQAKPEGHENADFAGTSLVTKHFKINLRYHRWSLRIIIYLILSRLGEDLQLNLFSSLK